MDQRKLHRQCTYKNKRKPNLSRLISPLRIGWKRGIYDEGVHDLVLDEQIEQYKEIGLNEEEAVDLIHVKAI